MSTKKSDIFDTDADYQRHEVVWWVLGYFGIGIAIAAGKWILFNYGVSRRIETARREFSDENDLDKMTPEQRRERLASYVYEKRYHIYKDSKSINWNKAAESNEALVVELTPDALDYADRIAFWVLQWPFVVLGTLLEDILFRIGEWVSELFKGLFTRLTRAIIGQAVKGI